MNFFATKENIKAKKIFTNLGSSCEYL